MAVGATATTVNGALTVVEPRVTTIGLEPSVSELPTSMLPVRLPLLSTVAVPVAEPLVNATDAVPATGQNWPDSETWLPDAPCVGVATTVGCPTDPPPPVNTHTFRLLLNAGM